MLIVPASNVSVPFTVVMRSLSSAPLRETDPPIINVPAKSDLPATDEAVHKLPEIFVITILPKAVTAALPPEKINPEVRFPVVIILEPIDAYDPIYPVLVKEPDPI
jgi:hypothetical protein